MKIISSSPYAAFNPKDWNSKSVANYRFSNQPIKIQKKFSATIARIDSKADFLNNEKKEYPLQMQLTFA